MWKDSLALVLQFLGDGGNAWGCVVWVVATTGPSELGFAGQEKDLDMSAQILAQQFQRLRLAYQ